MLANCHGHRSIAIETSLQHRRVNSEPTADFDGMYTLGRTHALPTATIKPRDA